MGKLEIKDKEKTLIVHEISRMAKEKDQEIKSWEERYAKSTTSHGDEVKKLDSRLAEQAVEIKQLCEASTRNQEEMKSMKINLQDNISLLNNVLSELRAEEVTPREDTIIAHTSTIGEQVGTLQELVTTLKTNQTDSIKEAVEGAVSYVLAKLKAYDSNLSLQPIKVDFDCSEAEAERLIEEMQSVNKKVTEDMQIGSPSLE